MKTKLIGENNPSINNIFINRGINPNSIFRLGKEALIDPFELKNMKEAIEKVKEHIDKGSLIYLELDPDADGITSTSLLYNYLVKCYPSLKDRLSIGVKDDKIHGIDIEAVELISKAKGEEVKLVIAPDASSNEFDVHKALVDKGIDVVVLDHHEADDGYSPYAIMVNPSLDDYPNKNISGVGVVQKFASAFDKQFGFNFSDNYFDLVSIGMVGDMIEINTTESIFMVQEGMRNIKNKMLKTMVDANSYRLGDQLTPTGIAFNITPVINAMTRVGTIDEKIIMMRAFVTEEEDYTKSTKRGAKEGDLEEIHAQANRIMNNVRSRQNRQRDKAYDEVIDQVSDKDQVALLDTEGKYPSSFNGLLANQVRAKIGKPTMIGKIVEIDNRKVFKGSSRGDEKSPLAKMKTFLNESGLVDYAQGHEAAHGFQFPLENREKIIGLFNTFLEGKDLSPTYDIDFDIPFSLLDKNDMMEITRYTTFWTRGLEEPMFLLRDVPVSKSTVEVSGNFDSHTVKFVVEPYHFIQFRVSTAQASILSKNQETLVDLVGSVSINTYGGESNLQIMVQDFEVKKQTKFIF